MSLRLPRALASVPSCALLALSVLVLAAPGAHAANVDLLAGPLEDLTTPSALTGDSNFAGTVVGNATATSTNGTVQIDVPAVAKPLGVIVSSSTGGGLVRPACASQAVGSTTRLTCPVTFAKRSATAVVIGVGVQRAGAARISFVATPGAGDRDPTPANAKNASSYRTSGPTCTVTGTNASFAGPAGAPVAEQVLGTEGNDVLCGFGGMDVCTGNLIKKITCTQFLPDDVRGLGGDDLVLLPAVNSTARGREGDVVDLGEGTDAIVNADSGAGDSEAQLGPDGFLEFLYEGGAHVRHQVKSSEAYFGNAGSDRVTGGDGPEVINGGGGHDDLAGGAGNDTLLGGSGDDTLSGDLGVDVLDGGPGTLDTASLGAAIGGTVDLAKRTLVAYGEVDVLVGIEAAQGGAGNDILIGSPRGDFFVGSPGVDTITGGGGSDFLTFDALTRKKGVVIDVARGKVTGGTATTFTSVESFIGSPFADVFKGGPGPDFFSGDAGNDVADGNGGADLLMGGDGVDTLRGGAGRDELHGEAGRDRLIGGNGRDDCRQDETSRVTDC